MKKTFLSTFVLLILSASFTQAESIYNDAKNLEGATLPNNIPDILRNYFSDTSVSVETIRKGCRQVREREACGSFKRRKRRFEVKTSDSVYNYISSSGSVSQMKNTFYTAYNAGAIKIQASSWWDNLITKAALTFGRFFGK